MQNRKNTELGSILPTESKILPVLCFTRCKGDVSAFERSKHREETRGRLVWDTDFF